MNSISKRKRFWPKIDKPGSYNNFRSSVWLHNKGTSRYSNYSSFKQARSIINKVTMQIARTGRTMTLSFKGRILRHQLHNDAATTNTHGKMAAAASADRAHAAQLWHSASSTLISLWVYRSLFRPHLFNTIDALSHCLKHNAHSTLCY